MISFNKVLPKLYVGMMPFVLEDISEIKRQTNIDAIFSLQTDQDFIDYKIDWESFKKEYNNLNIELCHFPITDLNAEDLKLKVFEAAGKLNDLMDRGKTVYLHCTAGVFRSPTVAIAYMYIYKGYRIEDAIFKMRSVRKCNPCMSALRELKVREIKNKYISS